MGGKPKSSTSFACCTGTAAQGRAAKGVRRGTAPFLSHGNARWVMVTSVLDKDLCDGVSWLSLRMLPRVVPQEHHTGVSYEVNFLP